MKVGPILFSAPMVQAIMRKPPQTPKRQTRRAEKDLQWHGCLTGDCPHDQQAQCDEELRVSALYGGTADLLYVRETCWIWGKWERDGKTAAGRQKWRFYEDEKRLVMHERPELEQFTYQGDSHSGYVGRNSIHMPRWASRITLRLTETRVERLQDISEADAYAEGITEEEADTALMMAERMNQREPRPARSCFEWLWVSINGQASWGANPFVRVLTFGYINKNVDDYLKEIGA